MKKTILLLVVLLMLFGCSNEKVEDIDGVFTYGINTTTTVGDEYVYDSYYEQIVYVKDGYVEKVQTKDYYYYDDISDYFDMTPESFFAEQYDIYENAVSETGFAILMPEDNGSAIVTTYESDYHDLSLMKYDYLPSASLNEKGDKIIFQKYIEDQGLEGHEIQ